MGPMAMVSRRRSRRMVCPDCGWRGRVPLRVGQGFVSCRGCQERVYVPFSVSAGVTVDLARHPSSGAVVISRRGLPRPIARRERRRWSGYEGLSVATKGGVPALLGAGAYALLGGTAVTHWALVLFVSFTALIAALGAAVVAVGTFDLLRACAYRLFDRRDPQPAGALLLDAGLTRLGL